MYIADQLKQFSKRFSVSSIFSHLDVAEFVRLHQQLLSQPTNTERQVMRSTQLMDNLEKKSVTNTNDDRQVVTAIMMKGQKLSSTTRSSL